MTPRRITIGIAAVLAIHNILRAAATALGTGNGFFNYLPLYRYEVVNTPPVFPVISLLFALALAWGMWRRAPDERSGSMWNSAFWSALTSVGLGLVFVLVATTVEKTYGWSLFVLLPVLMGVQSALLMGRRRPVTLGQCFGVASLSVVFLGGALLLFAAEGLICLIMAVPIAIPLAMLGGAIGCVLQRTAAADSSVTFLLLVGLTPFSATLEHALQPPAELFSVSTTIELRESPERVWETVLQPARLQPPVHPLFRAGVAYPLTSHIEGTGPTATRYCDFSTGKLVERVLIWDPSQQLRFSVVSNPLPMQEWTPYAQIHPPHLDGFLVSRQGEFRLTRLPDGGTRLAATTWYQHHLWPARYWHWWSDYIIHQVHEMVLQDVRRRADS